MRTSILAHHRRNHKRKSEQPVTGRINCRTLAGFLRRVTCTLTFGHKTPRGVRPAKTAEECADYFNTNRHGKLWTVEGLANHCRGDCTLYYFGSDDNREPYTLVMVDVDCHKTGTPQGAKAFADKMASLWPGSHWETSTNGRGQHGYILVEKEGHQPETVKEGLRALERWLGEQAEGFDVEMVEVKGAPPVVSWGGGCIGQITYGTFAKLPRTATLDDLQRLHVISLTELRSCRFDTVKKAAPKAGSTGWRFADERGLTRLEAFAASEGLVGMRAGRAVVRAADTAMALAVLAWCHDHRNEDGSLPTARVKAIWQGLVEQGVARVSFDPQKWKAIRNALSARGLLEWTDNSYRIGTPDQKGRAMKWSLTDDFAAVVRGLLEPTSKCQGAGGALYTDSEKEAFHKCLGRGEHLLPADVIRLADHVNDPDILEIRHGDASGATDWWRQCAA